MKIRSTELREALAGEYVIGTMTGAARRRFRRALNSDPRLRAEVELWEKRLQPLVEAVPEQTPPPRVWAAIALRTQPHAPREDVAWWSRLWVWRSAAGFALACALVLAVTLGVVLDRPPELRYVAVVLDAQSRGAWLVSLDPREATATARPIVDQTLDKGRDFELWLLSASELPKSLGVLNPQGMTAIDLVATIQSLLPRATGLAVSVEPPGGSPTGQPTGPVRYQGTLVKL